MRARTTIAGTLLALSLVPGGAIHPSLFAASRESFDRGEVVKGAGLAAIGNCATCHTSSDGKAFAGGRSLDTPFGTIYSTNITADPQTGVGQWSEADFSRAMRQGIGRDGQELYPAFPYDHFTRVADDDMAALYAFIMTREPVRAEVPANRLRFPMSLRPAIGVWKTLYFRPGVYRPDPSQSAQWNRGAYLVEGLAPCGACHTPRDALGAERSQQPLGGGDAGGWHATSLAGDSPAPVRWSADQLYGYKNLAAYCALAVEVEVERETGRVRLMRVVAAVDSGQVVNPDGIRNQIEGGIIQSMSWALYEAVGFDATRITSTDWGRYPIARFTEMPDTVDVQVIDRPGTPFLGTGEAAQGPTAAAIANALADAAGVRLRELPLTRASIKAAIGV